MGRESATREEPSQNTSLGHTAWNAISASLTPTALYNDQFGLQTNFLDRQRLSSLSSHSPNFSRFEPVQIPSRPSSQSPYQHPSPFEFVARHEMSRHSSSKSSKASQQYQLMSSESPADQAKAMSQNNKDQLINSLKSHKVNTITELRRIEKIFAYLDSQEVTEPMTAAWAHYVNSNNLLSELRGLTKKLPFSSECLDEAKALVVADPSSVRSWNYCWLVLVKIEKESLILKHARALASKRSTWGDRQPTADDARKFISAVVGEWTSALRQLLKHWDTPPSTTGS